MKIAMFFIYRPWPQKYLRMTLSTIYYEYLNIVKINSQTFEYFVFIKLQIYADVDPNLGSFMKKMIGGQSMI